MTRAFAARVIAWQETHGRHDLPWQATRDPYRVWLSEIMLQQTQVATVVDYYGRFLQRFPDVLALAVAPLDDVLAAWSGLGYYSRARNLHRCAQLVVQRHGGSFPRRPDELQALPGIGPSTAAAIAAFCFGARAAILDGNVKRVLARWLAFDGDLARSRDVAALWERARELLPHEGIEAYTQGLMDLGATLCLTRNPRCNECPVAGDCRARAQGAPERYPIKLRRAHRSRRSTVWLWLRWRGRWWLQQRPHAGVWAGLWSLPEFDDFEALGRASRCWVGRGEALPSLVHALTHLDWELHPRRWTFADEADASSPLGPSVHGRWFTPDEAFASALPAPLRRLLESRT
jgi:A/G-specific adenine glycosylase